MRRRSSSVSEVTGVDTPRLCPKGERFAYCVTVADCENDSYSRQLMVGDRNTGVCQQLTSGEFNDTQPVWSPDGGRLAFVREERAESGEAMYQLCLMPLCTAGEVVKLASLMEHIQQVTWSPDGTQLLFCSRVRREDRCSGRPWHRPVRKIDRLQARFDNVGWTIGRPRQLFVVDAEGNGLPLQVTGGDAESYDGTFAPDGETIAYVCAPQRDADLDKVNDLWLMRLEGDGTEEPGCEEWSQSAERLTDTDAIVRLPSWSSDGTEIAFYRTTGPTRRRPGPAHSDVAVLNVRDRDVSVLTGQVDRNVVSVGPRPPAWASDGYKVIVAIEDRGDVPLVKVDEDGGLSTLVRAGTVADYEIGSDGDTVIYAGSTIDRPPELYLQHGGSTYRMTKHNRRATSGVSKHFVVESEDECNIDAWVLLPAGLEWSDPGGTVPVVLSIHGGPTLQYGNGWSSEFEMLRDAGYAVVFCNPHGSSGYTEHFSRAIMSPVADTPGTGWGGIDYRDLMRVVDSALESTPVLDPERIGVLGGSYGGFMTSWIVGQSDRFQAACSERAVNDLLSMNWTSDTAGITHLNTGADPLVHRDEVLRMSPVSYVENISTPLLLIHSEDDLRCPPGQAEALFVPLRRLGRNVEYWRFPGEGHELSRSGTPKHRIQRANLICSWFDQWLKIGSRSSGLDGEGATTGQTSGVLGG